MFTKKQTQLERLPPTRDALHQAIKQAHYQAIIWDNDTVPMYVCMSGYLYCTLFCACPTRMHTVFTDSTPYETRQFSAVCRTAAQLA